MKALPRLGNVVLAAVHPVDQVAIVGTQRRGEFAVAAVDVHDQAALDAGGVQDLVRSLLLRGGAGVCGERVGAQRPCYRQR